MYRSQLKTLNSILLKERSSAKVSTQNLKPSTQNFKTSKERSSFEN